MKPKYLMERQQLDVAKVTHNMSYRTPQAKPTLLLKNWLRMIGSDIPARDDPEFELLIIRLRRTIINTYQRSPNLKLTIYEQKSIGSELTRWEGT